MLPFAALAGLAGNASTLAGSAGLSGLSSSLGGLSAGLGAAGAALGPIGLGIGLVTGFMNDRDMDKANKSKARAKQAMARAKQSIEKANIAIQKKNITRKYNTAFTSMIHQEAAAHELGQQHGGNIAVGSNKALRQNYRDKLDAAKKHALDDVNTLENPQYKIDALDTYVEQTAVSNLFSKVGGLKFAGEKANKAPDLIGGTDNLGNTFRGR